MYAIKGGWVGQTFALATSNDSGGRKARIRRSKEERKAMVESFIKRYQILNDGNFPSLNLTHKEVGGSFYTVREIVREIIQENKVLGPARFSSEVQKDAEDCSLGSTSSQAILLSLNDIDAASKHQENDGNLLTSGINGHCDNHQDLDSLEFSCEHQADGMIEDSDELAIKSVRENDQQYASLEPSVNNIGQCVNENQGADAQFADERIEDSNELAIESVGENDQQYASLEPSVNNIGQCVNENQVADAQFADGTQSNGVSEESDEMVGEESRVSGSSEKERQKELVGACNAKLTLLTVELEVETFPLRPEIKEIDDLSSTSTGSGIINGTLNNLGTKHNEISNGIPDQDKFASPDSLSDTVTAKRADGSEHSTAPGMVIQETKIENKTIQHEEANSANKMSEMLDSAAIKDKSLPFNQGCVGQVASHSGSTSNTIKQTEKIDELQSMKAPKGAPCMEPSNNISSKATASAVSNGSYIRSENKTMNGVSPTVDRIDLESWESKRNSNQETNPLLAFFKGFVDAIAKFWSE